MSADTARAPGFYWVRTGPLPVVGEWTGRMWWIAGIHEPVLDGHLDVVGARICGRDDLPTVEDGPR